MSLRPVLLSTLLWLLAAPAEGRTPPAPWGSGQSQPGDLEVSLVTFGPGPEVPSWFGHTALVVEDRRLGVSRLYNYGMFSFGPDMLARFAMGRLEFWVDETSAVLPTYRFYASENRHVRLQRLNLEPAQAATLATALAQNVLPENRNYLYHHYFDNCATRPRDVIDQALGGQLRRQTATQGRMTLRDHTRRHSHVFPPLSVLLDFLMNDEIDQPVSRWDEAFLPAELEAQLASGTRPDGAPLVAEDRTWFAATRTDPPPQPPAYGPWLLLLGLVGGGGGLLLALWAQKRGGKLPRVLLGAWNVLLGLVLGLAGTVLFLMWMITEHTVTHRNENLFLAGPLTLLALPLGVALIAGRERAGRALRALWWVLAGSSLLGLLLKVLPAFDQDNWRLFALLLPVNLGMAAASLVYEAQARRTQAPGERTDGRPQREDPRAPSEVGRAPGASLTSNASGRGSR